MKHLEECSVAPIDSGEKMSDVILRIFEDGLAIAVPDTATDLIDSGYLDSLTLVDLLMQFETKFGFTVVMDELELEDFRTVERIVGYVERCRKN
jgi:acyl carrier protein